MSTPTPPDLAPGQIRFFDTYQPPLKVADYMLTASQAITLPAPWSQAPEVLTRVQPMQVLGPHFGLGAGDVVAVYPPASSNSEYGQSLPHVVLARRTLPWEILLYDKGPDDTPWLALLLFTPDELVPAPAGAGAAAGNLTQTQTVGVQELLAPSAAGVVGPALLTGPQQDQLDDVRTWGERLDVTVVDVKPEAFRAIVPAVDELGYLAHARQINSDGQELHSTPEDGWFSVVIGNRLPTGSPSNVYVAHLVSLEGYAGYLPPAPGQAGQPPQVAFPAGTTAVRLLSLTSWVFTSPPEPGDFKALMGALSVDALRLPTAWLGADGGPVVSGTQTLKGVLQAGYAPLDYQTRVGDRTTGWYRGPCSPVNTLRNMQPAYPSAQAAMVYDSASGMFDLSFATAWEAGRMRALADRHFATSLLAWVRQANGLGQLLVDRLQFWSASNEADPAKLLAPDFMRGQARSYLATSLAPRLVPTEPTTAPLLGAPRDPSGLLRHRGQLPGLLSPAQVAALAASPGDPHAAVATGLRAARKGPDA